MGGPRPTTETEFRQKVRSQTEFGNEGKPYTSVDASSLPAGLTIDDGTATSYRLFFVNFGSTVAFHRLTLANGGGAGFSGSGGGIFNNGTLTLTHR